MCQSDTNGPVSKSWKICNFNDTCGHKHDGSLTYQKSAQNLEAYKKMSI